MNDRLRDTPAADAQAPLLERHDEDGIATLVLNRPRQFNALSRALLEALHAQIDALARDESVRVVIVTGAGRAVCSGHDLKEMRAASQADVEALFTSCSAMISEQGPANVSIAIRCWRA